MLIVVVSEMLYLRIIVYMYTTVQESISILLKRLKASHCSSLTLITIIVAAQPHDGPLQYSLIDACMYSSHMV